MVQRKDAVIVNALVRQALIASQEVMGEKGLNTILNNSGLERFVYNFPPDDLKPGVRAAEYARLNQAIEDFYGRGGRGILKRIGKTSFQYGVREQPALMGFAWIALKALPHKRRIKFVFSSIAEALKISNPQVKAWAGEENGKIFFIKSTCAICKGRLSDRPICHLFVGSLSEAILWATGESYDVRETDCLAMGNDYCRFEVGRKLP